MEIRAISSVRENQIKKVAAYARVSTAEEEQVYSYDGQKQYYETLIRNNPKWEFVDIYADKGISGTTQNRPEFQRMLGDAYGGKIDLILVKSISRFARNAVDTQEIIHKLSSRDIEVYFEEQKISSTDRGLEMFLNMMAMVAENESKSISQNTQWALNRLAERGIRHLGNNRVYGYDEINGELVPNQDAKFVKMIFEAYADGATYPEILKRLNKAGAKCLRSDKGLTTAALKGILRNELYTGNMVIQKGPHRNFLTKKPDYARSYNSYYVEGHHKGIVSKRLWEAAQVRLDAKEEDRKKGINKTCRSHFLTGRVICGNCGSQYRRVGDCTGKKGVYRMVWKCFERRKGPKGNGCKNANIKEDELLEKISLQIGIPWNGPEAVKEEQFECIEKVMILPDGEIEVILIN